MESEESIKKLKTRYDEMYSKTRAQQEEDKEYIDDTFTPKTVRHPHAIRRLGYGAKIVNSPAEKIVTSNPQVFVKVMKRGKWVEDEQSLRISSVFNSWIEVLKRQNPNPFKESVKNKLGRGENYINLAHNETWVTGDKSKRGLPVHFIIPDPMVIYGSPEEDEDGVPARKIVSYERQFEEVIVRYPDWKRPDDKKDKKEVEWFEYWDKDTKHFEADGIVVLRVTNIYGFNPTIRKYSGFGRRSPDGELKHLIVSDILNSRGLIEEICTMESDIASVMHLSAHKSKLITSTGEINRDQIKQNLKFGTYDLSILDMLPPDFKLEDLGVEQPTLEAYAHLASLKADLSLRHPLILAGSAVGIGGRQQSMADVNALASYDTIVENTELEWATAFERSWVICKTVPTLVPEGIHKADLDAKIKCEVKLKAKDPIEESRLVNMGSRLLLNKEIDPMTNLIEFKGYTQEKARKILVDTLMWGVLLESPEIRSLIGLRAAEKAGMLEDLRSIIQQRQSAEGQGIKESQPRTTQERIRGEVETQLGEEQAPEGVREARESPVAFTRGR